MAVIIEDDWDGKPIEGGYITLVSVRYYPSKTSSKFEWLGAREEKSFRSGTNVGLWIDDQIAAKKAIIEQES